MVRLKKSRKWLKRGPYSFFVPPVKFWILRVMSLLELLLSNQREAFTYSFGSHVTKKFEKNNENIEVAQIGLQNSSGKRLQQNQNIPIFSKVLATQSSQS